MSGLKKEIKEIKKELTEIFNNHALKIAVIGGVVSTILSSYFGAILLTGAGIELYRRYKKGERVWADPPDNPNNKSENDEPVKRSFHPQGPE